MRPQTWDIGEWKERRSHDTGTRGSARQGDSNRPREHDRGRASHVRYGRWSDGPRRQHRSDSTGTLPDPNAAEPTSDFAPDKSTPVASPSSTCRGRAAHRLRCGQNNGGPGRSADAHDHSTRALPSNQIDTRWLSSGISFAPGDFDSSKGPLLAPMLQQTRPEKAERRVRAGSGLGPPPLTPDKGR